MAMQLTVPEWLEFFATHPDPGDRADEVRAQIAALPPKELRKDSPRFHEIRARVQKKE